VARVEMFSELGSAVVPDVLSVTEAERLTTLLPPLSSPGRSSRTLLNAPWCRDLARSLRQHPSIAPLLPELAVATQCTLSSKSPKGNWLVALHQDLSIPVSAQVSCPGCAGWSEKEGEIFVQPPLSVLESLLAVRVHLDPCPSDAGALRVVPGSHRFGRLGGTEPAERSCGPRDGVSISDPSRLSRRERPEYVRPIATAHGEERPGGAGRLWPALLPVAQRPDIYMQQLREFRLAQGLKPSSSAAA
jgi:hypothetical protein